MGFKNVLFADSLNSTTVDCTSRKITAKEFCIKKLNNDELFVRAFVDTKKDEVVCQRGDRVLLTISCDEKHLKYCLKSSLSGCTQLKKYFALNHELIHHSILRNSDIHNLHCYFSAKSKLE